MSTGINCKFVFLFDMRYLLFFGLLLPLQANTQASLVLKKVIKGGLTPKSVVASGTGLFFAQNMMYSHTVNVYNRDYQLVKTIKDDITPSEYGFDEIEGELKGSPVECAFSDNGKYAWISNYNMTGEGFKNPGCDSCRGSNYDKSFIYKINTTTLKVENIVETGSVPKYLCVSPDNKYLLVSNWSSSDISVIDLKTEKQVKKISTGAHPRGIAIDNKSKYAYVAVMGSHRVDRIDLETLENEHFLSPGKGPRHLCISPDDKWLYISLNSEHSIAKVSLETLQTEKIKVKGMPRSMVLDDDAEALYAVNYSAAEMLKINCHPFSVSDTVKTHSHPIGITYDQASREVWVACYSGSIMVFEDTLQNTVSEGENSLAWMDKLSENTMESLSKLNVIDNITSSLPEKKKTEKSNPETVIAKKEEPEKEKIKEVKPAITATTASSGYYVIVGSFKDPNNAKKKQGMMKNKGYECTTFTGSNGMTYAALGGYSEKNSADELLSKVKNEEKGAWILKR